ncbi:translation initiation factor IF-2 [Candidatus Nomurabacteria bacterium]|jgi:translation initiation factor IF-2|nr:translation initiation factor IF-2 [Candidatus Saccharibacteria bacterium]MCB9822244.1 translation initiation factor IF-2 [Candidatus Nomurabacteria bacterium]MDQ5970196.1 translation initiation factor [Patescibacteria group bacterium]
MEKKVIIIENMITVGDLATKLDIPVSNLIGELFKNGIMTTVNQLIDFDTAEIIVSELKLEVKLSRNNDNEESEDTSQKSERHTAETAEVRPPVVAVMGHVDHGKTSLLDAILNQKVVSGEAGGITQHISAYQTTHGDRKITLLDTPGHEAFSALRQHGARLTDVVIIVVAADDGVKPQTVEAIKFAQSAKAKIIVALNKIDKPEADANRAKQSLAEAGLMPEDWGGDTTIVEVSAKTKQGIEQLLDLIILMADIEELKGDIEGLAEGIVIEAHLEQGKGATVSAMIEHGRLEKANFVVIGTTYGKIRTLEDWSGVPIVFAGPSTPVKMTGFKELPQFGDRVTVAASEKEARERADSAKDKAVKGRLNMTSNDLLGLINKNAQLKEVPIIIKADVQGSLTSISDSLRLLENQELKMQIIGSGIGGVSESDVQMASTSGALIYAFNTSAQSAVKKLAEREGVSIREFKVIYELLDDAKEVLSALLEPEIVETDIGKLVIKGVFRTTKDEIICGGEVTKGKVEPGIKARVFRDKELLGEVDVVKVQRQQSEAKEVFEGEMCGLSLNTSKKMLIEEGDKLEFYKSEEIQRTL